LGTGKNTGENLAKTGAKCARKEKNSNLDACKVRQKPIQGQQTEVSSGK